ncbi:hypothetical protein JCM13304A_07970 [Desulfothermus okinawensis JCM 13304]
MGVEIISTEEQPLLDRGYVISIVITNFKQRRNVEVHLFRPSWDAEEYAQYDWPEIIGNPLPGAKEIDPISSRKVLLETFNQEEKDKIVNYLKERYKDRLKEIRVSILGLPIPLGLVGLSEIKPQGDIGIIEFEKIPNYPLDFVFHGLYNLSRHEEIK